MDLSDRVVGIAKQTNRSTIATNPTFAHGITTGGLTVRPVDDRTRATGAGRTGGSRMDRLRSENGAGWTTFSYVDSVGLYLVGVLGDIATVSATKKTHTITPTSGVLPFMTFFQKVAAEIQAVAGCKINEIKFEWSENGPLMISVNAPGMGWSKPATFVPGTNETDSGKYLRAVAGTFKYNVIGASLEMPVLGGSVTIRNSTSPKFKSGSLAAWDVGQKAVETEVSITTQPDDLSDWYKIVTGSANGASVAAVPTPGSYELTFANGADSLKLADNNTYFMCDYPEGNPDGGDAEVELSGLGTNITATLVNDVTSY